MKLNQYFQVPTAMIKNLSVQTAYFQNGLVKAKSSWQLEQQYQLPSSSNNNNQPESSASILSKTVQQQPLFTLTWFPIKCIHQQTTDNNPVTMSPKQLPTPITATTINTHFEIYELKHNCDYVLNVKLVSSGQYSAMRGGGGSVAPQIASAQFRVPGCHKITVVGRIRPICFTDYVDNNDEQQIDTESNDATFSTTYSPTTIRFAYFL